MRKRLADMSVDNGEVGNWFLYIGSGNESSHEEGRAAVNILCEVHFAFLIALSTISSDGSDGRFCAHKDTTFARA